MIVNSGEGRSLWSLVSWLLAAGSFTTSRPRERAGEESRAVLPGETPMKKGIVEIKDKIYWVGVVDWNLRDFHGFTTPKGGSYNAYLLDGPEPILIDTVKRPFAEELLGKIREIVDISTIKHLVVNHIEPDHSGSLPVVLEAAPHATIYTDEISRIGLKKYYQIDREMQIVRTGDERQLGDRLFRFIEVPMAHWPDSMISYLPQEKVLFSSDVFGQFNATSERFDYEVDPPYKDAAVYYANIILPFNDIVLKTLKALPAFQVEPEYVLPDHGIIWRDHIQDIVEHYRYWASNACAQNILILYDTMWNSTDRLAAKIYEELVPRAQKKGMSVKKLHLRSNAMSTIMTEIMFAKSIVIGSPTILNGVFPSVGQLMSFVQNFNLKDRFWTAFGSYGWGGGAVEALTRWIKENQFALAAEPMSVKFAPDDAELEACADFAEAIIQNTTP
ncbi:MBL fold metallo-hydrolase [candidate division KSB3 bacterium]|uniref:MBL fold metallo-hydrolase n=1 Tax=candidate division KSB3 bacterium TaxID=2044937 RepID=A0A9D5Q6U4_9BACT|nr:MBL fold metallo-hydrolase [candidate division KSB3 bacterium]MBD3325587.1 MBL fold metallo-hydrolase [candidate division KSB3 bacterium]